MRGGWQTWKLDELGDIGRGRSRHRPRNDASLYGGDYPFFQTGDVKAAEFHLRHYTQTYNEKGLAQSKMWQPGTLCITIAANIAETAILAIPGCFPDSVVGFTANPDRCDVRYIKYYIDTIKMNMQNISRGTTQDNLSLDKLLTFDIHLPPLPTQRRIASILSAYDDLIENNTRRIAILEEMAQSLYREWFVHFRYPGHEHVPLVDSPLGPVPEGWEVTKFISIADVLSGGTPKTTVPEYWGGEIPFFSPKDAQRWSYVLDTEKTITQAGLDRCNSSLYPKDTVFITARGTVGKVVLASRDMAMNQSCYALVGRNEMPQRFLFLCTLNAVDELKQKTHGAVFDTIIVDTFRQLDVINPPRALTERLESSVAPMFDQVLNLLLRNEVLRSTRDMLLPKLVAGEVNIEHGCSPM